MTAADCARQTPPLSERAEGRLLDCFAPLAMTGTIKKYPVRDYLSVENSVSQARHAVGMPPHILDASLRGAIVGRRCFSTERYIPWNVH